MGNKLAPGLLDRYLGKTGFDSQQTSEPEDPNRPNNLWEPLKGDHGAHGHSTIRHTKPVLSFRQALAAVGSAPAWRPSQPQFCLLRGAGESLPLAIRKHSRNYGSIFLSFASAAAQADVATIIRRSSEANDRDWAAVPEFDNYERGRNKDGDKTYAVTMLYGSPYERLIEMNGRPLPVAKQKQEQEKYDKAVAERQHESPEKRCQRIAKYQADRKRDHTLIEQMTTAFDFRLAGKRVLNRHKVYVLNATPR